MKNLKPQWVNFYQLDNLLIGNAIAFKTAYHGYES